MSPTDHGGANVLLVVATRAPLRAGKVHNIFGVPGRERNLAQLTKRQCSSVRNAWRADLINGVDPKNFVALTDFVYASALKYRSGGVGEGVPEIYTVHAVLLVRFHLPKKRHQTAILNTTRERTPRLRKKPKKMPAKKAGKVAKGENFWGRVDEWFKAEVAERGSSLTGPKWKSYIDQLLIDDQRQFKRLVPGSAVIGRENLQPSHSSNLSEPLVPPPLQSQDEFGGYYFSSSGEVLRSLQATTTIIPLLWACFGTVDVASFLSSTTTQAASLYSHRQGVPIPQVISNSIKNATQPTAPVFPLALSSQMSDPAHPVNVMHIPPDLPRRHWWQYIAAPAPLGQDGPVTQCKAGMQVYGSASPRPECGPGSTTPPSPPGSFRAHASFNTSSKDGSLWSVSTAASARIDLSLYGSKGISTQSILRFWPADCADGRQAVAGYWTEYWPDIGRRFFA
ncbi:hypothetical protein B0H14DRAFT_2600130 [Mycena olivaceomarginata]|nr:hypothetical protein B0H14DRAFT_2600130 [Mycena olivaceomarginata]